MAGIRSQKSGVRSQASGVRRHKSRVPRAACPPAPTLSRLARAGKLLVAPVLSISLLAGCAGYDVWPTPAAPAPLSASGSAPVSAIQQASHVSAHNADLVHRVQDVGRKVANANPALGFRPVFRVTGETGPVLSHKGEQELIISEGLVQRCQTEGQLAALLCFELGKMSAERQARIQQLASASQREPPPEVRIGPDGGSFGDADQIRKAELVKLGLERRRAAETPPQPPDPRDLARQYLTRAGYAERELDAIEPFVPGNHAQP